VIKKMKVKTVKYRIGILVFAMVGSVILGSGCSSHNTQPTVAEIQTQTQAPAASSSQPAVPSAAQLSQTANSQTPSQLQARIQAIEAMGKADALKRAAAHN
jgi:hypothetical protein